MISLLGECLSRPVSLTKIVITGNKGGTGKTTIAALLAEYLTYQKKKVNLIDTAGVSGGSEIYLKRADLMLVPFIPHYVDLQVIIPWYNSLSWQDKQKVYFLPNRYQKTKEQQEGLAQLLNETGRDMEVGVILPPLSHRPALYGSVLNGSKENFFTKKDSEPAKKVFQELLNHYAKNKKSN